jgi:hypothetical protein
MALSNHRETVMQFKEISAVDSVLSLDVSMDGQDVLLSLHLETDIGVRLPMSAKVAMRMWAVLDKARVDHGWPAPTMPVLADRIQ